MSKYKTGKEYDVEHRGYSMFRIRVEKVEGDDLRGTITKGVCRWPFTWMRKVGDPVLICVKWPGQKLTPVE